MFKIRNGAHQNSVAVIFPPLGGSVCLSSCFLFVPELNLPSLLHQAEDAGTVAPASGIS